MRAPAKSERARDRQVLSETLGTATDFIRTHCRFVPAREAPAVPRFDGADAWERLTDAERRIIGKHALEAVVAHLGEQNCKELSRDGWPYRDAFSAANGGLFQLGVEILSFRVPSVFAGDVYPVPSLVGNVCRECGCTEVSAGEQLRSWVEEDLCSACAGAKIEEAINSE